MSQVEVITNNVVQQKKKGYISCHCIAKKEKDYIEEFIKYHLVLGFKHVILYDNEDEPTYKDFLSKYSCKLTVIHLPFNNYSKAVQYHALDNFTSFLQSKKKTAITHVAHIDIDEFIVLKKHDNICDFIEEYFQGNTGAIGMNWLFFGSSNSENNPSIPVTRRFTMCAKKGDKHIKTLFDVRYFQSFNTCL